MIVDLSHEIAAGMTTYPGIAAPELVVTTSRPASAARLGSGASFEIESLTLPGNTGTCLHSPFDSLSIDNPAGPARPAHSRLPGADIPIIEHLTGLEALPDRGARLFALPAPVRGMASFPVRVIAVLGG